MHLQELLLGHNKGEVEFFDKALLVLSDDTVFEGYSVGYSGSTVGELVFNTAITGYQEIISDPSYMGQIITLTFPHIGNVGCNEDDLESKKISANGLVVRDLPKNYSNFRARESLSNFLVKKRIVAISNIDTRKLTRHLRSNGAINGSIVSFKSSEDSGRHAALESAKSLLKKSQNLKGKNLAKEASTQDKFFWNSRSLGYQERVKNESYLIIVFDLGVKSNILRILIDLGCKVIVVPYDTSFEEAKELGADGILLSNGPGDPEPCHHAIEVAKKAIEENFPVFGICLGHQILALACGGKTKKMKVGHHGANHPIQDLNTGKVFISSQNHGFTVDANSIKNQLKITHKSLFDGTVQGLAHTSSPAFGFQGHPEASPGPHDLKEIFLTFLNSIKSKKKL